MNIISTSYTLKYKSLDIYVAGCSGSPHCIECHNPESWDFNIGEKYDLKYWNKLNSKITNFQNLIDNIMIFGGEPLDQNHNELSNLLYSLYDTVQIPIWLFTRFEFDDVPQFVKDTCAYIKCGRYIKELRTDDNIQYGIKLSSSNQYIKKCGELE